MVIFSNSWNIKEDPELYASYLLSTVVNRMTQVATLPVCLILITGWSRQHWLKDIDIIKASQHGFMENIQSKYTSVRIEISLLKKAGEIHFTFCRTFQLGRMLKRTKSFRTTWKVSNHHNHLFSFNLLFQIIYNNLSQKAKYSQNRAEGKKLSSSSTESVTWNHITSKTQVWQTWIWWIMEMTLLK